MELKTTARGQVTIRKQVFEHLGVTRGESITVELLPGQEVRLTATRPSGSITDFFGCLAGRTTKAATIEEISEAAARGWAGLVD